MLFIFQYILKSIGVIKLFFILLIKKNKSIFIKYGKNIGPERRNREYKQFTLNMEGLPFDKNEYKYLAIENILFLYFNYYILKNLYKYIYIYLI